MHPMLLTKSALIQRVGIWALMHSHLEPTSTTSWRSTWLLSASWGQSYLKKTSGLEGIAYVVVTTVVITTFSDFEVSTSFMFLHLMIHLRFLAVCKGKDYCIVMGHIESCSTFLESVSSSCLNNIRKEFIGFFPLLIYLPTMPIVFLLFWYCHAP